MHICLFSGSTASAAHIVCEGAEIGVITVGDVTLVYLLREFGQVSVFYRIISDTCMKYKGLCAFVKSVFAVAIAHGKHGFVLAFHNTSLISIEIKE